MKEKKVVLVCEVAGDLWVKMFGFLLGTLGKIIEIFYLRFIYAAIPFITISDSAKIDLIKNGVKEKYINVIPIGVNIPHRLPEIKREAIPTIIFLGRVSKSKGIEDAILVFKKLTAKREMRMWVCGRYETSYINKLKDLISSNGLESNISFLGYLTENEKFNILSRSWILIHPSKTEGWGINVIEANALGVPAVGYNVPGLQDSIQDGRTGLLTKENSVGGLAKAVNLLLTNKRLYKKLSQEAIIWSKNFTWKKTGEKTWSILKEIYEE